MKKMIYWGALSLFLLLSACSDSKSASDNYSSAVPQRCVDKDNKVLDPKTCEDLERKRDAYVQEHPGATASNDNFLRDLLIYHWLFGGQQGYVAPGQYVYGGYTSRPIASPVYRSYSPSSGSIINSNGSRSSFSGSSPAMSSSSGTARGVFGSAGRGFSGGE